MLCLVYLKLVGRTWLDNMVKFLHVFFIQGILHRNRGQKLNHGEQGGDFWPSSGVFRPSTFWPTTSRTHGATWEFLNFPVVSWVNWIYTRHGGPLLWSSHHLNSWEGRPEYSLKFTMLPGKLDCKFFELKGPQDDYFVLSSHHEPSTK